MCFELESNMVVYPISKINMSRNQELEMELVSLTVASYPCDLMFCGLEILD